MVVRYGTVALHCMHSRNIWKGIRSCFIAREQRVSRIWLTPTGLSEVLLPRNVEMVFSEALLAFGLLPNTHATVLHLHVWERWALVSAHDKVGFEVEQWMHLQNLWMHSHYIPESSEYPHRLSWHETQDLTDHTVRRYAWVVLKFSQAYNALRPLSRCSQHMYMPIQCLYSPFVASNKPISPFAGMT